MDSGTVPEKIWIVDFGSQYTQLIARRIRELGVFSEITGYRSLEPSIPATVRGVIISGSPMSVHDLKDKHSYEAILNWGVPVLGICFGAQLIAALLGGRVDKSIKREYGPATISLTHPESKLFKGINAQSAQVWMSHADTIVKIPPRAILTAVSESGAVAAYEVITGERHIYGVQFHPEVAHTPIGTQLLHNFVFEICKCRGGWSLENFVEEEIRAIRERASTGKVIMALSGGVDSTVAAVLIQRAVGRRRFHGVFVDTGLMRMNEPQEIMTALKQKLGLNVRKISARRRFLIALKGVKSPERKRKIIGREFIRVFEEEARRVGEVRWLGQGTIYPDVIESAGAGAGAHKIKSHHNVGGLPRRLKLGLIEPLRMLFKDEVRKVGELLGIPSEILYRHPFPGPGLAVRIVGDVTPARLRIVRHADHILITELKKSGWYEKVWQAGAILLPVRSVGVMGDTRTYQYAICVRIVTSSDGMTADWARVPYEVLARISTRIVNEVKGVNRVVYDLTTKPPGTIEWE